MSTLIIQGKHDIAGHIRVGGNKNAALPLIAAAVLADSGEVVLRNVPDIIDVRNMLSIIEELGGQTSIDAEGVVHIHATALSSGMISTDASQRIRTSLLFAGPLCTRFGSSRVGCPGGDLIGRRRLDMHFYGLRKLGMEVNSSGDTYDFNITSAGLAGAELFLDEASVTATEHIMMVACRAKGHTIIRNAACEPHVVQLANLLNRMGANIHGEGTNKIEIDGVESLHGADINLESDYIEACSFLALTAAAGGHIEIEGEIHPYSYWMARRVFERFNCFFSIQSNKLVLESPAPGELRVMPDENNAIPVVSDGPWPQFPSDMMSCMIALATQAAGTVMFFEKMFESRLYFVDKLVAMGASAVVCDPHRVIISGPARLHGVDMTSPDIRAGMALVVGACCAHGTSRIHNIDMVKRGYADLTRKLQSLGIPCEETAD